MLFVFGLDGTLLNSKKEISESNKNVVQKLYLAENKIGRFTKQDIRELCPSLSISSIEGALRNLVEAGELKREG